MQPGENKDWQQRLDELEREMGTESQSEGEPTSPSSSLSTDVERWTSQIRQWFGGLPSLGKVAVAGVAVVLAFSALNAFLKLVASLISLGGLAIVVYVAYKFFIASDEQGESSPTHRRDRH